MSADKSRRYIQRNSYSNDDELLHVTQGTLTDKKKQIKKTGRLQIKNRQNQSTVPEVRKMVPTGVTGCKGHEGLLRVPFLDLRTATLMSHVLTCRCARELPHFSATAERGAPTQLRFQVQIREQFLLLGQRLRVSSGRPPLASSTRTSGLPAVLPRPTHAWHPTHRSARKDVRPTAWKATGLPRERRCP